MQRVLLAPATSDSRDILLAVTQLLMYEQWQRGQQQGRRLLQQQQQQRRVLTYRELKTLCNQVMQPAVLFTLQV